MTAARPDRGALPVLTCTFVGIALVLSLAPGLADHLEYRREEVAAGAIWRALTGQAVHWGLRMTLVDLGSVLLLGSWCERRQRRLFAATWCVSMVFVGAGLHTMTRVATYRGASGIASALFIAACLDALRPGAGPRVVGSILALIALFLVKVGIEAITGTALAAGPLPPGVEVVPAVHLIGAGAGACGWWLGRG